MLHDVVDDPGARSEVELLGAHVDRLSAIIATVGPDVAADETGVAGEAIAAVIEGDIEAAGALDVGAAAAILALEDDAPSPREIDAAAREALLFGMTAGVLNVDVLAGEVADDLDPRAIQGMLEGRHPMSLRTFVALQRAIERRSR